MEGQVMAKDVKYGGTKVTRKMKAERAAKKKARDARKANASRPSGAGARRDKKLSKAEHSALGLKEW